MRPAVEKIACKPTQRKCWRVAAPEEYRTVSHKIVSASRQRTDLRGLFTSFTANDPQQVVKIDREKAKAIGVPMPTAPPSIIAKSRSRPDIR